MSKQVEQILEKADIAVSNLITARNAGATGTGGYLNPMQSNKFLRDIQEQPTMIKLIRFVPMSSPQMEVNKIGFASRILRAAPASGTALAAGSRSKPTTRQVTLNTCEMLAEVHIPYDVLEDNIERGTLEDTVMALIVQRSSLDLEEWVVTADTASGDAFLALRDGILKQATSHVVDFSDTDGAVSKSIFKYGLRAMPNKYLANRSAYRFLVSPGVELEYADTLANRETQLGDSKITMWTPNRAYGVPVIPVAHMPDDKYLFCHPKNIILGVQRDIMIETDRDIRSRVLIVVVTLRVDLKYEEEDAVVKAIGLNPDLDSPTTTT